MPFQGCPCSCHVLSSHSPLLFLPLICIFSSFHSPLAILSVSATLPLSWADTRRATNYHHYTVQGWTKQRLKASRLWTTRVSSFLMTSESLIRSSSIQNWFGSIRMSWFGYVDNSYAIECYVWFFFFFLAVFLSFVLTYLCYFSNNPRISTWRMNQGLLQIHWCNCFMKRGLQCDIFL